MRDGFKIEGDDGECLVYIWFYFFENVLMIFSCKVEVVGIMLVIRLKSSINVIVDLMILIVMMIGGKVFFSFVLVFVSRFVVRLSLISLLSRERKIDLVRIRLKIVLLWKFSVLSILIFLVCLVMESIMVVLIMIRMDMNVVLIISDRMVVILLNCFRKVWLKVVLVEVFVLVEELVNMLLMLCEMFLFSVVFLVRSMN